MICIIFLF